VFFVSGEQHDPEHDFKPFAEEHNSAPHKQHRTSGIQIVLLGVLLLLFYRPSPKPTGYGDPSAPPAGLYRCWSGGFDHLAAGTLTLAANGRYESYRSGGGGSYSFLPASSSITFLNGDYYFWEYRGVYQRTHETPPVPSPASLTNTVQSNPTLPELPGERIVLIPVEATDAIGTERPGEYQYCYRENATAGITGH
jgi:hypothetical protein